MLAGCWHWLCGIHLHSCSSFSTAGSDAEPHAMARTSWRSCRKAQAWSCLRPGSRESPAALLPGTSSTLHDPVQLLRLTCCRVRHGAACNGEVRAGGAAGRLRPGPACAQSVARVQQPLCRGPAAHCTTLFLLLRLTCCRVRHRAACNGELRAGGAARGLRPGPACAQGVARVQQPLCRGPAAGCALCRCCAWAPGLHAWRFCCTAAAALCTPEHYRRQACPVRHCAGRAPWRHNQGSLNLVTLLHIGTPAAACGGCSIAEHSCAPAGCQEGGAPISDVRAAAALPHCLL